MNDARNYQRRVELLTWHELSEKDRDDLGYMVSNDEHHDPRFFRFMGDWYDLGQFMLSNIPGWTGQYTDTFFSAVVVNYHEDDGFIDVAQVSA